MIKEQKKENKIIGNVAIILMGILSIGAFFLPFVFAYGNSTNGVGLLRGILYGTTESFRDSDIVSATFFQDTIISPDAICSIWAYLSTVFIILAIVTALVMVIFAIMQIVGKKANSVVCKWASYLSTVFIVLAFIFFVVRSVSINSTIEVIEIGYAFVLTICLLGSASVLNYLKIK